MLDHCREPTRPARRYRAFNAGAGLPPPPVQQLQRALNHAALARDSLAPAAQPGCPAAPRPTKPRSRTASTAPQLDYVLASRPLKYPLTTLLSTPPLHAQLHPPIWCLAPTPCTATGRRRSDTRSWAMHWSTASPRRHDLPPRGALPTWRSEDTPELPHRRRPRWTPAYGPHDRQPAAVSRAAKTAASAHEDVARVKEKSPMTPRTWARRSPGW